MSTSGRTSSGNAQDPLNFLQRSISTSTKLSKVARMHAATIIRRVKANGPYTLDESMAQALRIDAYVEYIRLRELRDGLKVADRAYKPTVWALGKLSEIMVKFKTHKSNTGKNGNQQRKAGASALWQGPKTSHVPPEPDGGTA